MRKSLGGFSCAAVSGGSMAIELGESRAGRQASKQPVEVFALIHLSDEVHFDVSAYDTDCGQVVPRIKGRYLAT
jgi:hypothetical protein